MKVFQAERAMKERIINLWSNNFLQNVIVLATGTAMSQAVTLAFSPILTRLYGPESFGVLGVFLAFVGIIAPVSSLSYPDAIVLPASDRDAKILASLALSIALANSLIALLIFIAAGQWLSQMFEANSIERFFLFIPVAMIFTSTTQVLQQWLIRKKQFTVIARSTLSLSIIVGCLQVGFGLWMPETAVLISINSISTLLGTTVLAAHMKDHISTVVVQKGTNLQSMIEVASKYSDFAIFRAPNVAIGAFSQSLPVIILGYFLGPDAAGYYTVGRAALAMPTHLVGRSVGDVLYPRLAESVRKGENIAPLLVRATGTLAGISIIPFGLIVLIGPPLFGFAFGPRWIIAGEYARWLALWVYFSLLNVPSVAAIPVLNMQRIHLYYELCCIMIRGGALYAGFVLFASDIGVVACLSLAGTALNMILIAWVLLQANSRERIKS